MSQSERSVEKLLASIREAAEQSVWSKAVELARNGEFIEFAGGTPSEFSVRVVSGISGRSQLATFDQDFWQCDCSDDDPCVHVTAALIAFKQGKTKRLATSESAAQVVHLIENIDGYISLTRVLEIGATRSQIESSLQSCREDLRKRFGARMTFLASADDEAVDLFLSDKKGGVLTPKTVKLIMPVLERVSQLEYLGHPIKAARQVSSPSLTISDEPNGVRLRLDYPDGLTERFLNGAGISAGKLVIVDDGELSPEELARFAPPGAFVERQRLQELYDDLLPRLEKRIRIDNQSSLKALRLKPRIILSLIEDQFKRSLVVVPKLVYGEPVVAEVERGKIKTHAAVTLIRNREEETRLAAQLNAELGLSPGVAKQLRGEEAFYFTERMHGYELEGSGKDTFRKAQRLTAQIEFDAGSVSVSFRAEGALETLSFKEVNQSYSTGAKFLQFSDGSWAELPDDWLERYGARVKTLLSLAEGRERLPVFAVPEAAAICEEMGLEVPEQLRSLRERLLDRSEAAPFELPTDLTANLREYQIAGVRWLNNLLELGVGALLADDMGLGKTVQALSVAKPGTLIVAPTSVLSSWQEQITRFRPALSINLYHGPNRNFNSAADLTITSYALLRLDQRLFTERDWRLVILDEAQTIKNSDALVSRAAHALRSEQRIALSGTPVENRVDDLWSIFQFLVPGLLPSKSSTRELSIERLKSLVRPFILRRLKRDVAKELPEKTEVVIECELSPPERELYNALIASTRSSVKNLLQSGASVMNLLEALLRLRQACCHTALVPGSELAVSSKLELLFEELERSIVGGHKALVFSQWTGLLDLVEAGLASRGLTFSRLDGSTQNRGELVAEFQSEQGPDLMLLSLKAGGVGLTLTKADHVYMLDPWWNPFVEDQAADRAHRIGQERAVMVYKLVAKDTLEERVIALQREKRLVFDSILGDGGEAHGLSREDLLKLIS